MAKAITYECKECGCEIIVSGSHESHLRPIYCCGVEVVKVYSASKGTGAGKKVAKKPARKPVKKIAKKPGNKPARKKTSSMMKKSAR